MLTEKGQAILFKIFSDYRFSYIEKHSCKNVIGSSGLIVGKVITNLSENDIERAFLKTIHDATGAHDSEKVLAMIAEIE